MSKPKRLWKNLKVKKISILTDDWNPANGETALYKTAGNLSSENSLQKDTAVKCGNLVTMCKVDRQDNEEGLLYVTVAKVDPDSDGDAPANLKELKKAAHEFAKAGNIGKGCVDHNHDGQDMDGCFVAESTVNEQTGRWEAVIDINGNADMMQKARAGQITGVSLFGSAEVQDLLEKGENGLFERFIGWIKGTGLQKGFKENIATADWWRVSDAFTSAIRQILEDEAVTDKAAAIDQQVEDFRSYVKKSLNIDTNLTKGDQEMKESELEKILAEKYGIKPQDPPKIVEVQLPAPTGESELVKTLSKQVEQLAVAVDTLAKGRTTQGDLGGDNNVTMAELLKSADKLEEFQKKHPERYAALVQSYVGAD